MSASSRRHVSKPRRRWPPPFVWALGLAGLVAAMMLAALVLPDFVTSLGEDKSNDNRTWLTRSWTQAPAPDADLDALTALLTDNGIEGVYVQTHAWHAETGEYILLPYAEDFATRFATRAEMRRYAWLTLERERLENAADREQVVRAAQEALSAGYTGIHVQVLSVPDDSQSYIGLLRDLRAALGDDVPLSVTVPPDRTPSDPEIPPSPLANNDLTWSDRYKRSILLIVDEFILMGHASGIDNRDDYETWLRYQVDEYADIMTGLELDLSFIVALPTYDAEPGHDPSIENPETAIDAIIGAESVAQVDGVGLYPWELTDLHELDTYWEDWVQR